MGFQIIADTKELSNGGKKLIVVDDLEILLTNIDGGYYAISNKCPHMGGSLFKGSLENGVITCPRHGSKYDAKTGKALRKAKILFLEFNVNDDRSYPVKIEGTNILIDLESE